MTNFIPLFPLNIVVYPGEHLNLHIFEPRYKQLISECFKEQKEFGIATVFHQDVSEMGTTVRILSIEKIHDNGEMDIKTMGGRVFKILERIRSIPEKLYGGAIVTYPENVQDGIQSKLEALLQELRQFHELLEVKKDYRRDDRPLNTYDLAHHAGLSLEQEYQLLELLHEAQRQEFLQRHLRKTIPT
ncbi:MAG TPA: LON peptidase substrate-binding domain-containing protein, partial [Chitinophagaceae bacterium]|nr:LON peptidase substrate-binding domain-containing protein [Chitinophagaceae bacterium]